MTLRDDLRWAGGSLRCRCNAQSPGPPMASASLAEPARARRRVLASGAHAPSRASRPSRARPAEISAQVEELTARKRLFAGTLRAGSATPLSCSSSSRSPSSPSSSSSSSSSSSPSSSSSSSSSPSSSSSSSSTSHPSDRSKLSRRGLGRRCMDSWLRLTPSSSLVPPLPWQLLEARYFRTISQRTSRNFAHARLTVRRTRRPTSRLSPMSRAPPYARALTQKIQTVPSEGPSSTCRASLQAPLRHLDRGKLTAAGKAERGTRAATATCGDTCRAGPGNGRLAARAVLHVPWNAGHAVAGNRSVTAPCTAYSILGSTDTGVHCAAAASALHTNGTGTCIYSASPAVAPRNVPYHGR